MMHTDNDGYFNFKAESELPEEHSQDMKKCPHCGKPIPVDSLFCLYCGEAVPAGKKNIWMILLMILILAAFIMWAVVL
ncbi:MAG: zinc-ribbon domain-containing protein [Candidatus Omnitrophota bacterium]